MRARSALRTPLVEPLAPVARLCPPREHVARPHRATRRLTAPSQHLSRLLWEGCVSAGRGALRTASHGLRELGGGLGALAQGQGRVGARRLGRALRLVPRLVLDVAWSVGARLVSGVQTRLGREPVGSRLGVRQLTELRKVFGDSVDLERVRLKSGRLGLLARPGRAFVLGHVIYVPGEEPGPGVTPLPPPLLVREVGRVWQYQHGGTDYGCETLGARASDDWRTALDAGRCWDELEPGQQVDFLQAACGRSRDVLAPGQRFIDDATGVDYTPQLVAALDCLRTGSGAP